MSKPPHPYSAQITAKAIKDWKAFPLDQVSIGGWPSETWQHLRSKDPNSKPCKLHYRRWSDDYICYPDGFNDDISFDDKLKLGKTIISPYFEYYYKQQEKAKILAAKKEKREHLKSIKDFLKE